MTKSLSGQCASNFVTSSMAKLEGRVKVETILSTTFSL
jgi:hypothetical protein